MKNPFTHHPHSVGETYGEHLFFAGRFGFGMAIAGFACMIHAVFPFVFKKTASDMLIKQMNQFIDRMPVVEERVVTLSRSIERKMGYGKAQASPFSVSIMQYDTNTD